MDNFKYKRKSKKDVMKNLKKLKNYKLTIGWFDAKYEDGTPVEQVAMIQEFGAPERNISPRPFMRPAKMEHEQEWKEQLAKAMKKVHTGRVNQEEALEELGETIVKDIKQAIMNVTFPPLKADTIKNRRRKGNYSEKPLIDTKHMFDTLKFEVKRK